ncbi:MAG: CBS domain-containing protein [Aigarchaeota archaeon]|nr:CBS domain-containing protein [Candidatus Pelearchaeum maunauluense]
MAPLTVGDVMTRKIIWVREDETLKDAALKMTTSDVGCVLVLDDDGRCIGILTERDFVRLFANDVESTSLVKDYMTKNPITVNEMTSIAEAKNIMATHRFRHLPVTDNSERVIGVLSIRDIVERVQVYI